MQHCLYLLTQRIVSRARVAHIIITISAWAWQKMVFKYPLYLLASLFFFFFLAYYWSIYILDENVRFECVMFPWMLMMNISSTVLCGTKSWERRFHLFMPLCFALELVSVFQVCDVNNCEGNHCRKYCRMANISLPRYKCFCWSGKNSNFTDCTKWNKGMMRRKTMWPIAVNTATYTVNMLSCWVLRWITYAQDWLLRAKSSLN